MSSIYLVIILLCLHHFAQSTSRSQQPVDSCANNDEACRERPIPTRPNVVLLLADDLGYGDLASYGHPSQEANAIDWLGREGIRFQQFYSADSMCTPSRAALMTGRLPIRTGMVGGRRVLLDYDTGGLPRSEVTLAEMFKKAGYNTGMIGKWHLGINAHNSTDGAHLPRHHGFDFVGLNLPFTHLWECDDSGFFQKDGAQNTKCHLYNGDKLVEQPYKLQSLAENMNRDWLHFLNLNLIANGNGTKPFFFYYSFPHVHSAQWASIKTNKSRRGLYGDTLNEMAWQIGQLVESLIQAKIHTNTLVLFMSDHGPHRELCNYGGSTAGFEGGFRIPAFAWWPGTIEAGQVSSAVLSSLDMMPSLTHLAGLSYANLYGRNLKLDGVDVLSYLLGDRLTDPDDSLTQLRPIFFYCNRKLMAIRYKHYKVHYRTTRTNVPAESCPGGKPLKDWYISQMCIDAEQIGHDPPLIYDLNMDPYERYKLDAALHAQLLDEIQDIVDTHEDGVVEVENVLGHFNARVIPCCNYPKCQCD